MYRCPVCKEELNKEGKQYVCENRHNFDIAKEGYVNLVVGKHKVQGDNSQLVKARTSFLQQGYYGFLRETILKILNEYNKSILVDIGCGEGYYSNYFMEKGFQVYGFDLSKEAIKFASKQTQTSYAVANIFNLPLFKECCDIVLSIFTPLPKEEIIRILKPNGIFIQVEPAEKHLYELKEILYDHVVENVLQSNEDMGLTLKKQIRVEEVMHLKSREDIQSLLFMTPYTYRTQPKQIEKLLLMETLDCTSSFHITVWEK